MRLLYLLRVVQIEIILFLRSMSERDRSEIQRLWNWIKIDSIAIEYHSNPESFYVGSASFRNWFQKSNFGMRLDFSVSWSGLFWIIFGFSNSNILTEFNLGFESMLSGWIIGLIRDNSNQMGMNLTLALSIHVHPSVHVNYQSRDLYLILQ